MITRSSIAFKDFLGSSIAPQVMPPCDQPDCKISEFYAFSWRGRNIDEDNILFIGTGWDWNREIWEFSAQFQLSIGKRSEREIRPACDCDFQSTLFSFRQKWKGNKSSFKRANNWSLWIFVTYDSLLSLLRMIASDKERFALAINTKAQCRCLTKANQAT